MELANEYDNAEFPAHQIAVRCLTPGFVATKMSRIRATSKSDTGWTYAPVSRSYASHSLRALDCHCACGRTVLRPEWTDRNNKGREGPGWLARVVSAVFDSPSSPLSAGCTGVTTTGYPSHTLMVTNHNDINILCLISTVMVYDRFSELFRSGNIDYSRYLSSTYI